MFAGAFDRRSIDGLLPMNDTQSLVFRPEANSICAQHERFRGLGVELERFAFHSKLMASSTEEIFDFFRDIPILKSYTLLVKRARGSVFRIVCSEGIT